MSEDFTMGTAQDDRDTAVRERNGVDAWHEVMTAVEGLQPHDLATAAKVLRHIGRALQAERNGDPHAYYETALNDAAATIRDTHPETRPGRITRIRALADAVEALELAQ